MVSNAGWIFNTPVSGFTDNDTSTYTISDGFGVPVTGNVTVTQTLNPGAWVRQSPGS